MLKEFVWFIHRLNVVLFLFPRLEVFSFVDSEIHVSFREMTEREKGRSGKELRIGSVRATWPVH